MRSTITVLGLAALASTAHADLLHTRNLRTRAKEPTKVINELVKEDMDFWGRELGGSARRNLKAIKKNDKAIEKKEDNQFWARELGGSARK